MGGMEIVSFYPKGFCDGVVNAFALAEKALKEHPGKTLYLVGSLVHNELAISSLLSKGCVILDERNGDLLTQMEALPNGSLVLYSAHGHDKDSYDRIARKKDFIVYDASCKHILSNIEKMKEVKGQIAFVCDPNHLEAKAISSLSNTTVIDPKNPTIDKYDDVISQTSLDEETYSEVVNELKKANPSIVSLGGRCPSTVLRQRNIIEAPDDIDLFIVIGSKDSSNTKRLAYLAKKYHQNADVIQALDVNELRKFDLSGYKKAALTSGASSSQTAYEDIKNYLKTL